MVGAAVLPRNCYQHSLHTSLLGFVCTVGDSKLLSYVDIPSSDSGIVRISKGLSYSQNKGDRENHSQQCRYVPLIFNSSCEALKANVIHTSALLYKLLIIYCICKSKCTLLCFLLICKFFLWHRVLRHKLSRSLYPKEFIVS